MRKLTTKPLPLAKQTLPPYFVGTAQQCTFYKLHGKYYFRLKSSLTAERVKTEECFAPTRWQASVMAQASKIGAAVYAAIPAFCREYKYYRQLTGKANLLLKKGLHEDEIVMRLIEYFVVPLKKQALKEERRERNREKRKRNKRTLKPPYLRHHRRLKMVEWSIGEGEPSIYPSDAIDSFLNTLLKYQPAETSPPGGS
jgi:hypothetical protein